MPSVTTVDHCLSRGILIVLGDIILLGLRVGYEIILCVGPHGFGTRKVSSSLLLDLDNWGLLVIEIRILPLV